MLSRLWCLVALFIGVCGGLEVRSTSHGKLDTYVSAVKLEGLSYSKRAVNVSVPVILKYEIKGVNSPSAVEFSWERDGEKITVSRRKTNDTPSLSGDYSSEIFFESMNTLEVVLHLNHKDPVPGSYALTVTAGDVTSSASGFAQSAPVLPLFTKPKRVLEGDIMRLVCSVRGYPKAASVMWSFSAIPTSQMDDDNALTSALYNLDNMITNGSNYVLETSEGGTVNDTLRFLELKNSDNGLYACNVSTELGSDFALMIVNVKDRWAALWPFIGIVIEVTILVVAILLYERHQMHSKPTNISAKCDTSVSAVGQENPSTTPNNNKAPATNNTGQNNLTVPVNVGDMGGEVDEGNIEGRDQKIDEIRLRANVKQ
ncbi:unnamed protein product [Heterobilharzia americana]|nr:unnamed protein product [Heterobilharzia americana]